MLEGKKGFVQHPMTWAFIAGLVLAFVLAFLLNNGMIPGIKFTLC